MGNLLTFWPVLQTAPNNSLETDRLTATVELSRSAMIVREEIDQPPL